MDYGDNMETCEHYTRATGGLYWCEKCGGVTASLPLSADEIAALKHFGLKMQPSTVGNAVFYFGSCLGGYGYKIAIDAYPEPDFDHIVWKLRELADSIENGDDDENHRDYIRSCASYEVYPYGVAEAALQGDEEERETLQHFGLHHDFDWEAYHRDHANDAAPVFDEEMPF